MERGDMDIHNPEPNHVTEGAMEMRDKNCKTPSEQGPVFVTTQGPVGTIPESYPEKTWKASSCANGVLVPLMRLEVMRWVESTMNDPSGTLGGKGTLFWTVFTFIEL